MNDGITVEVVLIVAATNIKSPGNTRFLFWNSGVDGALWLPSRRCHDNGIKCADSATEMLKSITGLEARWVGLKQEKIIDRIDENPRVLRVPYVCIIPETVDLRDEDAIWVSAMEILDSNGPLFADGHREIILQILGPSP